jgi:hypothetical protein
VGLANVDWMGEVVVGSDFRPLLRKPNSIRSRLCWDVIKPILNNPGAVLVVRLVQATPIGQRVTNGPPGGTLFTCGAIARFAAP